jgi:hypothetical protein
MGVCRKNNWPGLIMSIAMTTNARQLAACWNRRSPRKRKRTSARYLLVHTVSHPHRRPMLPLSPVAWWNLIAALYPRLGRFRAAPEF